jgi:hypothetical protein
VIIKLLLRIGFVSEDDDGNTHWPFSAPRWHTFMYYWKTDRKPYVFHNLRGVIKWQRGRLLPVRRGFGWCGFEFGDRGCFNRKPRSKKYRCYTVKQNGLYISCCIDMCLAAQHENGNIAECKLVHQVYDLLNDGITHRKSPLSQYVEYFWYKLTIPFSTWCIDSEILKEHEDSLIAVMAKEIDKLPLTVLEKRIRLSEAYMGLVKKNGNC